MRSVGLRISTLGQRLPISAEPYILCHDRLVIPRCGIQAVKLTDNEGIAMAKLHQYFLKFNDAIRLGTYDEEAGLREKRDILLSSLKKGLPEEVPSFSSFNQGSYALGTGVKPVDGDYDIDVGIVFDALPDDHAPVDIKKKVRDALAHPWRTIAIRRPCVTVTYMKDGKPDYHVDLAIYTKDRDGKRYLATGKESSGDDFCNWEVQDPEGLQNEILNRFSGEDRKQFRRIVRYMKRWRHYNFSHNGLNSIGLTVAAYRWFSPEKTQWDGEYNDMQALENLVTSMLGQFSYVFDDGKLVKRLVVKSPVEPWADFLVKMTVIQMTDFEGRLKSLQAALQDARSEVDEVVACKSMAKLFGDNFPIPEAKENSAAKVKRSVIGTGNSA